MFPEELITAVQQTAEVIAQALSEFAEKFKTLEELAYAAQEEIDAREEERGRWGNPPKALVAAYTQPAKKIRPCARSFGRR